MRYFVGFLATIGLIILAFVLIFNITDNDTDQTGRAEQTELVQYAASTKSVRLTVDGPINAESLHRQYQINVSQNRASLDVIGGYDGQVIETKAYDNTQQSYRTFLYALQRAGFNEGNQDESDPRGACPTGRRYLLEVWDGSERLQQFWTTTCRGGNYEGNLDQAITLFQRQIPDYTATVNKYDL